MTITETTIATNTIPAPTGDAAPSAPPAKGLSITAMVLGIIAIVLTLTFLFGQYGAVLGMIAAAFGFAAARKNKKNGHKRGMARAGMILGAIAIPLGFATAAMFMSAVDSVVEDIDQGFSVLEAEWFLESEYSDYVNDIDATAVAGDVVDGVTEIVVTETGTTNVLAQHTVQINDNGTFVILD
jgi:hypothetical protein